MTTTVVHQCPPKGWGVMPCCGRPPFECCADRMTLDPALVTCWAKPPLTAEFGIDGEDDQ